MWKAAIFASLTLFASAVTLQLIGFTEAASSFYQAMLGALALGVLDALYIFARRFL